MIQLLDFIKPFVQITLTAIIRIIGLIIILNLFCI